MYPPNVGSRCPTVLKNVKEKFRRKAIKQGDRPTQYANTPSCDLKTKFGNRYDNGVVIWVVNFSSGVHKIGKKTNITKINY